MVDIVLNVVIMPRKGIIWTLQQPFLDEEDFTSKCFKRSFKMQTFLLQDKRQKDSII